MPTIPTYPDPTRALLYRDPADTAHVYLRVPGDCLVTVDRDNVVIMIPIDQWKHISPANLDMCLALSPASK